MPADRFAQRAYHSSSTCGPAVLVIVVVALASALAACGDGSASAPSVTNRPAAETPAALVTPIVTPRRSVVAISAGHGGPNNVGAVHHDAQGRVDLVEKDLNLDVARRLDRLLRADGYRTVLIRDGDYSLVPSARVETTEGVRLESQARADVANEANADVIVALHFNGSTDPGQSGTEVYYNPDRSFGEESRVLATSVYDAIIGALRSLGYSARARGVMNDSRTAAAATAGQGHTFLLGDSPGFRATRMPGMIGEALFVTNDYEAQLLMRDDVRQAIAEAYKTGIESYFAWLGGRATATPAAR